MIPFAKRFSTAAHTGQTRKYTNEPYVTHPVAVADILASVTDDEHVIAAGLLHDVVEDTSTTLDEVKRNFGSQVSQLVREVTSISTSADGDRAQRKAIDRAHVANASARGKTIKLADIIHNLETIVQFDPKFAKTYMHEKRDLLTVLTEGNTILYARAKALIDDYFSEGAKT